jgi:hypothetical protein
LAAVAVVVTERQVPGAQAHHAQPLVAAVVAADRAVPLLASTTSSLPTPASLTTSVLGDRLVVVTVATRRGTPIALLLMVATVVGMLQAMRQAVPAKVGLVVPSEPLFAMVVLVHSPPTLLVSQPTTGGDVRALVAAVVVALVAILPLVQMLRAELMAAVALTNSSTPKSTVVPVERVVPEVLPTVDRQVVRH